MASDAETGTESETASILAISLVAYSPFLPVEEQNRLTSSLDEIVRDTLRFRVAEVAGKVICHVVDGGALLAFRSDPEAALECALQISESVQDRSEMRLRMGIHRGPVPHDVDLADRETWPIATCETARQIMACGDAGHILLSKQAAFELAPIPRWNAHLFELGEQQLDRGQNIALINFHTPTVGNSLLPTKLERTEAEYLAARKKRALRRRIAGIVGAVTVVSLLIFGVLFYRRPVVVAPPPQLHQVPEKSIAVMPFSDLSLNHDQEYFCDGVTEEILARLGKAPALVVAGQNSSFVFRGASHDVTEIGRKLRVATILSGKLFRETKRIRLITQLTDTRDGSLLWTKTFERELQELPEVEEEIVTSILQAFRLEAPPASPKLPGDPVAHDLYCQGLFLSHANREEDLRASIDFFRLALGKDSEMSAAWRGLARVWLKLSERQVPPLTVYPQVSVAAAKAVALDSEDAEAHLLLAEIKRVFEWDLKTAEDELARALQMNPSSSAAHFRLGAFLSNRGDPDHGLLEIEKAIELDPLSPAMLSEKIRILVANDRLDEAFAEVKHLMDVDPSYTYFEPDLALVYREQGKLQQALEIYSRLNQTRHEPSADLAITYALLHRIPEAQKVLDQLIELVDRRYVPGEEIAAVSIALGDKAKAFQWLDRAVEQRSFHLHQIATAPEFRRLRGDPRFTELLWRIGIDPAKLPYAQTVR